MVLGELSGSISRALQKMNNETVIDEKVLNDCLNEITRAILDDLAAGHNKRRIIQQAIFNELCEMLDTGKPSFVPKKGKTSVIMLAVQNTRIIIKNKGFKPALVCADTFRAGAFDQLKQNATTVKLRSRSTEAKIPFYSNYMESDPVKIAIEGVERFKKENFIDTSGRHQQEASLFEEMRQLVESTKPDLVIFVMDSSIGQAAF
ncbi:hypothetical protein MKW92_010442, partial [Papaver armeniacum]